MPTIYLSRQAAAEEIVREMDRRGEVIGRLEATIARLSAEAAAVRAGALEDDRTAYLWWTLADGVADEDRGLSRWEDALDDWPPLEPVEVEVAKKIGHRWAVLIPTDGGHDWHDDCHLFETEAEAAAAIRALAAPSSAGGQNG